MKKNFLIVFFLFLFVHLSAAQVNLNAKYTVQNSWPSGYQVEVTLTNNSSQQVTKWQSTFSLPAGQSISSLWNGVESASGQKITVTNPTWVGGGNISPNGGTTTYGFIVQNSNKSKNQLLSLAAVGNPGSGPTPPPVTPPSPPTLNSISNGGSSNYTVSWNSVANATSYTLQQSTSSSFSNPTVVTSGNVTSFNVTNQAAGTYYYRVSATNSAGTSAFSNVQSVTVSSSPTPPTPPPSGQPYIEGYWESWNSTDSVSTIVGMNANIIDVAFGTFTSQGNSQFVVSGLDCDQATLTSIIQDAHAAGKKIKISIGGASYPLQGMLKTTADAQGMAKAIATFVQQNSLDGVDFDIEDQTPASLQVALIQNTRQLLPNAIISYTPETPAATSSPWDQVIQDANSYLTSINMMAYNYGPGYTYKQDVTAFLGWGIPSTKIGIGLMPGKDDVGIETNVADIQAAANYILQNNLGGIMFWDLNRDHENQTGLGVDAATNAAYSILK